MTADVFDVDGFATTAAQVDDLHRRGRKVICRMSIAIVNERDPDYTRIQQLGRVGNLTTWVNGDHFVNIANDTDEAFQLWIRSRFEVCRDKHFDAIDPVFLESWWPPNKGFTITEAQQLAFDLRLVSFAHEYWLGIGANDSGKLVSHFTNGPDPTINFDFAIVADCANNPTYKCSTWKPFLDAQKAVLHYEHVADVNSPCPTSGIPFGFATIQKKVGSLNDPVWRKACSSQ